MKKKSLRKIFIQKRLEIQDKEYQILSEKIKGLFVNHFLNSDLNIHISISDISKKEVDTRSIIKELEIKRCNICVPKIDSDKNVLYNCLMDLNEELILNKYNILEPKSCTFFDPQKLDLIVIPALICDKYGNRIGYGKGYYDKFLKTCNKNALKIVLSFFDPINSIEDINEFDIPVNYYITPEKIFSF